MNSRRYLYTIGQNVFDDQHRHLLGIVERVREVALKRENHTADVLAEYLCRLLQIHFETEERTMGDRTRPDVAAHLDEHGQMLLQLQTYIQDFRRSGTTDMEGLGMLARSVHEHVMRSHSNIARVASILDRDELD